MIVEFFGLSKSGKSSLKRELAEKKYKVADIREYSLISIILFFVKYAVIHPIHIFYLFWKTNTNFIHISGISFYDYVKIFIMRNSYIFAVLSKYERIKKIKEDIFTDEFSLQAIFMVLQRKSSENEINNILKHMPKSDYIFLFLRSKERRHKAYKIPHKRIPGATLLPGSWINSKYAWEWMNVMEYNFEIIKGIIEKNYEEENNRFSDIEMNLPAVYRVK